MTTPPTRSVARLVARSGLPERLAAAALLSGFLWLLVGWAVA